MSSLKLLSSFRGVSRAAASQTAGPSRPLPRTGRGAFTLIELLVVMVIIILMMALAGPAVNALKGAGDITKAGYDIAGALEGARTYAMANNTYVWVGFFEEDNSRASTYPAATTGTGRVVISAVASQDGSRYSDASINATDPPAFGTELPSASPQKNQVKLVQLNKLIKLDNVHLAAVNDGLASGSANIPKRPPVLTSYGNLQVSYQVGDPPAQPPDNFAGGFARHVFNRGTLANTPSNPTYFTYPLTVPGAAAAATPQYKFAKIIEFNARGEVSKIDENTFSGPGPQTIEIAIQPVHGTLVDPRYSGTNSNKAAAAIQVEGMTGRVRVFRL